MSDKDPPSWRAAERLLDEFSICEHWMTTKVRTVAPTDSTEKARDCLKRYRINQLLGLITDRDIRSSLVPRGSAAESHQRVHSVMSRPAIALGCHSTLLNAAEVM